MRTLSSDRKVIPLDRVMTVEDLHPNPLAYDRMMLMEHIRRYDREQLREYYRRQPVEGAEVFANYVVNLWEYELGVEELTSYPWNITIPMTEVCNARCSFCSAPLVADPKASTVHEIRHFAQALRYALFVSLQGLGEPLAHPHFEAIAEEVKKYINPVARLEMITNAWLLSGRRWELLKAVNISFLQVSVNAATDQTHQIAMGSRPGTFEQVLRNIENVMADTGWPRILKVSMVITRHSLPEVTAFLDMFVKRGIVNFQFNALLPLTTPDWGFGKKDQYLELWCGHLPKARELIEQAKKAITKYESMGIRITATPDQWLIPVDQWGRSKKTQLSVAQQETAVVQQVSLSSAKASVHDLGALNIRGNGRKHVLAPHRKHVEIMESDASGTRFRATSDSCRWAYLLQTPRVMLPSGRYALELEIDVVAGRLYGSVLDSESGSFLAQAELHSGTNRIEFALPKQGVIEAIVRQGDDDGPVVATYRSGRLNMTAAQPDVNTDPQPSSLPCILFENTPLALIPHQDHTRALELDPRGVRFRGTATSSRWAYLLRTPSLTLSAGRYHLDMEVAIATGRLCVGLLDVEADRFVAQHELDQGANRLEFELPADRLVEAIVRQGDDDQPVEALYLSGRMGIIFCAAQCDSAADVQPKSSREVVAHQSAPANLTGQHQPAVLDAAIDDQPSKEIPEPIVSAGAKSSLAASKPAESAIPKRIYCPMVYNTLSVFHHSLDVSICCYMENAPGHKRPNLKEQSLLEVYNDPAFRLVRRTLTTDKHIPVCDTCPYGEFRS